MPIIKTNPTWKKHLSKDTTQQKVQIVIGSNLYQWRKWKGLSQSALAKKAGVTQKMISELESGDYNPSTETISKLANALDIDWNLLTSKDIKWKMLKVANYFLEKMKKVDILKAMKLLYLSDYEYQKKFSGERLVGLPYIRRNWGPFSKKVYQIEDIFPEKDGKFSSIPNHDKRALTTQEKDFLDIIIKEYEDIDSVELMKYTYTTKPMEGCTIGGDEKMGEELEVYSEE